MRKAQKIEWEIWLKDNSQISNYQVDSRNCSEGSIFFALPGAKTDGVLFLEQAAKNGAVAAVVPLSYEGKDFGMKIFYVQNVLETLQDLAKRKIKEISPQIIAVTGSVGKTTTKEFIATLLEAKYQLVKSPQNYNGQIGLPLAILNADPAKKLYVLEMAMTEKGHIERLVQIAPPNTAIITKIDWVHAENFSDGIEGIKRAKAEIFSSANTKLRIVPDENKELASAPKVTFSLTNRDADYFLTKIDNEFFLDERGVRAMQLDFPFQEKQFIEDALIAIAVAREHKLSYEEISKQIPKLTPPKMRFEKIDFHGITIINDAYNAGPESFRMAIENLPNPVKGRKLIAVFGEMSHLGKFADEVHETIGEYAAKRVDEVFCIGGLTEPICEVFRKAKKTATMYKSLSALTKKLQEVMLPGDVVLIKGSRHLALEQVLEKLR